MSNAPEQRFFDAPNAGGGTHRIAYLEWNKSDKPKLICVHGLTRNGHDFDALAEALSANYHIVAPDMAGRGKSEWLADSSLYHYGTYFADLIALLDHLGWKKLGWIGTSMGGILGMMMAANQPKRVSALVLNDIGLLVPKLGLERIAAYARHMTDYATRAEAEAAVRRNAASFGFRDEAEWQLFFRYSIEEAKGRWRLTCDPRILDPMKAQTDNYTNIQDVDLREVWKKITCPVLLLRGELSDVLPEAVAEEMQLSAGKRLTFRQIAGVGHAPNLMSGEQINLIRKWVAAHVYGGVINFLKRLLSK